MRHERNQGKGAALRSAFAQARGRIVVIQDADLEYDPVDIPELVAPIRSGVADAVFGSRLIGGRPQRAHLFWHKVGNRALSLLTNVLYNTTLSDMETGYKAFTLEVLRSIEPLYESDFRIEPELTAKICRGGFRIYEVPIAYYGRSYAEGKKITWRDGFPAVYALVKYRFPDVSACGARLAASRASRSRSSLAGSRSAVSTSTRCAARSAMRARAGSWPPSASRSSA